MPRNLVQRAVTLNDGASLASIHAACFPQSWDTQAMLNLLNGPGSFGLMVEDTKPQGFILCRVMASEAEILTMGVLPEARRRRLGSDLVKQALDLAYRHGAHAMYLEVEASNDSALRLYQNHGFVPVGRRTRYYTAHGGQQSDAIVMKRQLEMPRE